MTSDFKEKTFKLKNFKAKINEKKLVSVRQGSRYRSKVFFHQKKKPPKRLQKAYFIKLETVNGWKVVKVNRQEYLECMRPIWKEKKQIQRFMKLKEENEWTFTPIQNDEVSKSSGDDLEDVICSTEVSRRIYASLRKLDPVDREIIIRKYFQGKSFRQISKVVKLAPSTVSAHHNKALKLLNDLLKNL